MAKKGGDEDPAPTSDFDRDEDQLETIPCDRGGGMEEEKGVGHRRRKESNKRNPAVGILRIDTSAAAAAGAATGFDSRRKSSASSVGDFRCGGATLNPQVSRYSFRVFLLFLFNKSNTFLFHHKNEFSIENSRLVFFCFFFQSDRGSIFLCTSRVWPLLVLEKTKASKLFFLFLTCTTNVLAFPAIRHSVFSK